MRPATSPLAVWTAICGDSTLIDSVSAPGSSFASTTRTSATFRTMSVTTAVLKAANSTWTLYGPTGRSDNT